MRAYINSEREADIERAHMLCEEYGLDYAVMRAAILKEMAAYKPKERNESNSRF